MDQQDVAALSEEDRSVLARVNKRIVKRRGAAGASGCHIWTGGTTNGHPVLTLRCGVRTGNNFYVARWLWERFNGPIPAGGVIHHICGRSRCVALDHLALSAPRPAAPKQPGHPAPPKEPSIEEVERGVCRWCGAPILWVRRSVTWRIMEERGGAQQPHKCDPAAYHRKWDWAARYPGRTAEIVDDMIAEANLYRSQRWNGSVEIPGERKEAETAV